MSETKEFLDVIVAEDAYLLLVKLNLSFAQEEEVHPSLVVGQLQRKGLIKFSQFSELQRNPKPTEALKSMLNY